MRHAKKIPVVDRRKKRRSPLADAIFRAAAKIIRANGDPAQASAEVVAIYRRMNGELQNETGLMHFLEEVSAGIRAANERGRRNRSRKMRAACASIN
jgi:hypothetical protein